MFRVLLLSSLLLAAARIDIALHSCLDVSVESLPEYGKIRFSVDFDEQQCNGARLVPVLGFESYHDGRLEQRGSCSNIESGTTAASMQRSASSSQYVNAITSNGWERSRVEEPWASTHGVVTYSRVFDLDEFKNCLDYTHQPVLHYETAETSGTFYIALVQLSRSDGGGISDFARYIQPHRFRLSPGGNVISAFVGV
jgi:hypothetical protein